MKFLRFFLIIFISLTSSVKADFNKKLFNHLDDGGKLIFIRHAYAPGSGDPSNFNLNDCSTQRNLSEEGRKQAEYIGEFFRNKKIKIYKVLSSEWCRCKETAQIAFNKYEKKNFLNSFFSSRFFKNKESQMIKLKRFIYNHDNKKNIIFLTHYVVINETLNYSPNSGEIIVIDKNYNIYGNLITD